MRRVAAFGIAMILTGCAAPPPATPHSLSSTADTWCASCHAEGINAAPINLHPERANCVACHTPSGTVDVGALEAWPPPEVALGRP